MRSRGRGLVPIAFALGSLVLSAAPAGAAQICPSIAVVDSASDAWTVSGAYGVVYRGDPPAPYDQTERWGELKVAGQPYAADVNAHPEDCGTQVAPGDIRFGEVPTGATMVSRRVYIPPTGEPFIRFLDVIRNPTAGPVHASVIYSGALAYGASTLIVGTPDGNTSVAAGDPWTVSDFEQSPNGPSGLEILHVWDGETATGKADANDGIYSDDGLTTTWADGADTVRVKYSQPQVEIPAHGTVIYMHLEAARVTDAPSAFAHDYASGPARVFQRMTAAELAAVRNWSTVDVDSDGRQTASDNCPVTANPKQADLDHDGSGDACDQDIDGDGVSNFVEAIRKTNPHRADSDGDGRRDGVDVCPRTFGRAPNGCPDTTPPKLKLGKVPKKLTRGAFLDGVKVTVTVGEPTKLVAELRGDAQSAELTKASNVVLARRKAGFGTGKRTLSLKPSKRLVGHAKRFDATLEIVATDRSKNRTQRVRTIRVR